MSPTSQANGWTRSDFQRAQQIAQTNPAAYAHHLLGASLWSKQRDVINSVWQNRRTSVRSCHGAGKTYIAAACAVTFMSAWTNSRVITTAPIFSQVEHLLWPEIRSLIRGARIPLPAAGNTSWKLGEKWYALGIKSDDAKPERFQGHHAERLLIIYDEASGVDERIFDAAEGYMTSTGARELMIGNATQLAGKFHRSFHTDRAQYNTIHISAQDTPAFTGEPVPPSLLEHLISQEWVQEALEKWGEADPRYQVKVLGEFPTTADNTVISLAQLEAAHTRADSVDRRGTRGISVDVARFGCWLRIERRVVWLVTLWVSPVGNGIYEGRLRAALIFLDTCSVRWAARAVMPAMLQSTRSCRWVARSTTYTMRFIRAMPMNAIPIARPIAAMGSIMRPSSRSQLLMLRLRMGRGRRWVGLGCPAHTVCDAVQCVVVLLGVCGRDCPIRQWWLTKLVGLGEAVGSWSCCGLWVAALGRCVGLGVAHVEGSE